MVIKILKRLGKGDGNKWIKLYFVKIKKKLKMKNVYKVNIWCWIIRGLVCLWWWLW